MAARNNVQAKGERRKVAKSIEKRGGGKRRSGGAEREAAPVRVDSAHIAYHGA